MGRIVIGHPFTPPALMPVLEVYTQPCFEPSALKKEIPGFVGNRIQKVVMWEAISLLY